VAVFLAGITLIIGHATRYFGRPLPEGTVIEALGVVGLGALILAWLRSRRLDLVRSAFPDVTPGTPYRTASAKITPEFVSELANLESNLQRSAVEEGWSIEWGEHNKIFESANPFAIFPGRSIFSWGVSTSCAGRGNSFCAGDCEHHQKVKNPKESEIGNCQWAVGSWGN
jgi:hypothetical protein